MGTHIQQIIDRYQLQPHPEGGYFREVYRSEQILNSPVHNENRNAVTHIYFLLVKGQVSRFHKVIHDEIWNFYEGASLKLIEFNGSEIQEIIIGENDYFKVIKGGVFQAAESTGDYSLVGCSVAPGFDFKDFSFINSNSRNFETIKHKFQDYMKYL